MSRIAFCEACNMIRNGVKSRIALEHTCGLEAGAIPDNDDNWFREQKAQFKTQNEALFSRELLEPAYEEFMSKYATSANPSAYDFFVFLLRQSKTTK